MKKLLFITAIVISMAGCSKSEKEIELDKIEITQKRLELYQQLIMVRNDIDTKIMINELDSMMKQQDSITEIEIENIKL